MFLTVLIISVVIVAIAFIGLGLSIFFRKNGKFPETGVGHNTEMRKLGITCARSDEIKRFNLQKDIMAAKSTGQPLTVQNPGCTGCSCTPD
jgi:hypothetical protein